MASVNLSKVKAISYITPANPDTVTEPVLVVDSSAVAARDPVYPAYAINLQSLLRLILFDSSGK